MSNAKEIRGQIKSIKSTQKITRAMQMVAASKVRRAQNHMEAGRPYVNNLLRVINHLVKASSHDQHLFLRKPEKVDTVGYIVVSTDRGLCGGLNINLFKTLVDSARKHQEQGHKMVFSVLGRKGIGFLGKINANVLSAVEGYPENPQVHDLIGVVRPMIDAFVKGDVQRIYVVTNIYVNPMEQNPRAFQLLPATVNADLVDNETASHTWDYLYEPSAETILDDLLRRYIESAVKQAVVENVACEMSARMIAMQNATDNANSLINELELKYNKARQAAITQELTEIVAGADAV